MELWYTEEWTDNVRFSIKVDNHLFSDKSEFQQVDVFESKEFGKFCFFHTYSRPSRF